MSSLQGYLAGIIEQRRREPTDDLISTLIESQDGEAGLDLRTVSAMLRGGEAGPVIVRGHPNLSELVAKVESAEMPPDEDPLSPEQLQLIRNWIEADAASTRQAGASVSSPPGRPSPTLRPVSKAGTRQA